MANETSVRYYTKEERINIASIGGLPHTRKRSSDRPGVVNLVEIYNIPIQSYYNWRKIFKDNLIENPPKVTPITPADVKIHKAARDKAVEDLKVARKQRRVEMLASRPQSKRQREIKASTARRAARKSPDYLSNENMFNEWCSCLEKGAISDRLGGMYMKIVKKYGTKPNFSGYTYLEEMKGQAYLQFCSYWDRFNPEKSQNAFAYATQMIKNSFIQILNKEKKLSDTKKNLIEHGLCFQTGLKQSDIIKETDGSY